MDEHGAAAHAMEQVGTTVFGTTEPASVTELSAWLRAEGPRLESLFSAANDVRRRCVGDAVHLRGLIEVSNYCRRSCHYCGLRAQAALTRYRMSVDEVFESASLAHRLGYGTVVLQGGEDPLLDADWVLAVLRRLRELPLAVTLSLGERTVDELRAFRQAGADRYLLRLETSNEEVLDRIHPRLVGQAPGHRIALLRELRALGYQVGSGVMVGIPGTTWEDLARDLALFRALDLDMIGVGPYIPDPSTPLAQEPPSEVPNDVATTLKVVALARLQCPYANIPSTTALATLDSNGRELGLERGANVVMPNVTPLHYRQLYTIYPGKACISETAEACNACVTGRIRRIGRTVGVGRGDALHGPSPLGDAPSTGPEHIASEPLLRLRKQRHDEPTAATPDR